MKEKKGITLIALVVTIVVLLILAGVSIAMLTGDEGIIRNANDAKKKTTIGRYEEEIKILTSGEEIDYRREAITFDKLVENVENEIKKKDYVKNVTKKDVSTGVDLDVQTDLVLITVKLTENGSEIITEEINNNKPPQVANDSIFNWITNEDDKVEIIGFNFDNLEYDEITTEQVYNTAKFKIKNMPTLDIPSTIDGKDVVSVSLNTHIINGEEKNGYGDDYNPTVNNYGITGIKKVIYPSTVKVIGSSLPLIEVEEIVLSEGIIEIEYRAFYCWYSVESLTIPKSVNSINAPFIGWDGNEVITVEGKDSIADFTGYVSFEYWEIGHPTLTNINYLGK